MLFPSSLYFLRLAIAVVIYWTIGGLARVRLYFIALGGLAVIVYLLHENLQNEAALALLSTMVASIVSTYLLSTRLIHQRSQNLMLLGISVPFVVFLVPTLGYVAPGKSLSWIVPISLGFFSLRQSHFVYECYRRGIKQADFLSYGAYILFFPTLIAGPLERYPKFIDQVSKAKLSWDNFGVAAERLIVGALKKFVIADGLISAALPPMEVSQIGFADVTWWSLVAACTAKFLYVYFDFAGYTDMARGTARLFGIELIANFNFPLLRSNLAEFWRNWHISLSTFLRDYIYFPLVAKYRNTALPLFATMIASAAWHGVNPGWLLWGVHHGVGLVVLARFQRNAVKIHWLAQFRTTHMWRVIATLATWYFVILGFALTWRADSLSMSLKIYLRFLSFGLIE